MPRNSLFACAISVLFALLFALPAYADQRAQWLISQADDAFDVADYSRARELFLEAHKISPDPGLLFNIGSTYRRQGLLEPALEYYQRAQRDFEKGDPRHPIVKGIIADVKRELAARRRLATLPATAPLSGPAPAAYIPPPKVEPPGRPLLWTSIALGVAAAGSLGYAAYQTSQSRSAHEVVNAIGPGMVWDQAAYDQARRHKRRATWAGIAGGVGALGATALYLFHRRSQSNVSLETDGTTLALSGTF